MSWLSVPAGLILAAVVIPPLILLYFLKLRRRTQPIACTMLWKRSVEDLRANAPFQRLRRSILLLLQLLALILLALAIMQPQVQAGQRTTGKTVILIDNSASMTATDVEGEGTRLDEAKRRARDRIETLYDRGLFSSSAGQTMVIAFSDRAEVYCRFTDSKAQLLGAIDRIQPTHGESRITEALTLARAYTTNPDPESDRPVGDPATLELFSDGRIADLDEQVLRGETMLYHPIGSPQPDNVAVTVISIERPYDRPTAVEVFASLANFNTKPVTSDIQLSVDGVVRAIEEVTIGPAQIDASTAALVAQRRNVVFTPFDQPRGVVIEVASLRDDDLAADNAARLVVPPAKRLTVALVAPKSFLLRTALEGIGSIQQIEVLTASRYETLAEQGAIDQYDVVVFDDYAPEAGMMPPGRYLTLGSTPPLEGLNEFGRGEGQLILDVTDNHPVFRFVNLEQLYISRFHLLQPADDVQVLAEGSRGPAIVAVSRGQMQAICVTFDPLDSNWPFLRSFVTFIVNAVEYLGHAGEAISATSFAPGEALTTRLPVAADRIDIHLPDGGTQRLDPLDPALFSWGPIRLSGIYALSWSTPGSDQKHSRAFAVNLLSDREGDIRPVERILAKEEDVYVAGVGATQYTPLWPWAIGLCLAVLMLEWWIYHRKAYI
ncbi:MAG: BatA and WFA domain-containing protein [Planctomycetota bacterium]|nr:BatA and WFA domain-containing protein [Planctomycetota bacterium]